MWEIKIGSGGGKMEKETDEIISRPGEMDSRQLNEFIRNMIHRIIVHHVLWFREVQHQRGFDQAMEIMDKAWDKTWDISLRRFASMGLPVSNHMPKIIDDLPNEKKLAIIDGLAKNWLAQDGVFFQEVEKLYGMNDAKRCNDSTWNYFSLVEAREIKKLLGLPKHPGLEGLEKALNFRLYGRLNVQSCRWEEGALIFEMNRCRVQHARKAKGLPDYPCKSAGLVEYGRFAEGIDDRIKTTCIACPPDQHPEEWSCAWKFTI